MQQFFYVAAGLACPIGMGLMMWFMMRGVGDKQNRQHIEQPRDVWRAELPDGDLGVLTPEDKLAVRQERQRRLEAEIRTLQESEAEPSRN